MFEEVHETFVNITLLFSREQYAAAAAVRAALQARFGRVRWPGVAVDVDPVNVL